MVQMLVKVPGDGPREWAMIELQGSLETRQPVPLSGRFIGDLHFTQKDVPVFIIGHHILYGKTVKLEKPFAVLIKNRSTSPDAMETNQDVGTVTEADRKSDTSYTVQAIIRKKLIFKTRPKPIIANVPKKL